MALRRGAEGAAGVIERGLSGGSLPAVPHAGRQTPKMSDQGRRLLRSVAAVRTLPSCCDSCRTAWELRSPEGGRLLGGARRPQARLDELLLHTFLRECGVDSVSECSEGTPESVARCTAFARTHPHVVRGVGLEAHAVVEVAPFAAAVVQRSRPVQLAHLRERSTAPMRHY